MGAGKGNGRLALVPSRFGRPVYMVRQDAHFVRINPEEITVVQVGGEGVELLLGQEKIRVRGTIEEVLDLLPAGMMARINSEQAVNMDHLMMVGPGEVWVQGRPYVLGPDFEVSLLMRLHIVSGW